MQECKFHGYTGLGSKKKPEYGCEICNFLTIFTILAGGVKPGAKLDKTKLDEFEACIQAMCELDSEGLFDFVPKEPEITIKKNATED